MRKKIKYQGGITKYLCQQKARLYKSRFRTFIDAPGELPFIKKEAVNFEVISLSGASAFEEQMLSIYTFAVHAGIPKKWTIYSDKSYTAAQINAFTNKFPFVSVLDWDVYDVCSSNKLLHDYSKEHAMAKKLNIILGHPHSGQTIYVDSDILFYKNISYYLNSPLLAKGLWYASDVVWGPLNEHFENQEFLYPLNAGFLILNSDFDARDILQYFEKLKGEYDYFSEQSSFGYAFRKQAANMLDPRQFINDVSDQFDFSMKHYPDSIAMRHYVTPVRHKMFQRGWRWHFRN